MKWFKNIFSKNTNTQQDAQQIEEQFTCKGCGHKLPKQYSLRTNDYCYLCDPHIELSELLSDKPLENENKFSQEDHKRRDKIQSRFPSLGVRVINHKTIRVFKGNQKLDLFKSRFCEVNTGKRGYISTDFKEIKRYFGVK